MRLETRYVGTLSPPIRAKSDLLAIARVHVRGATGPEVNWGHFRLSAANRSG